MAVTIRVEGQAARRGLIPRVPAPDRLLGDACAWINGEYPTVVRTARIDRHPSGPELVLDLHPASPPLTIGADVEGRVIASADTSNAGPGYHTFVARVLDRLSERFEIAWTREHEPRPVGTAAPWIGARVPLVERAAVEREHLTLLGRVLARAIDLRRRGMDGIHVGTRSGTQFTFDGAIATPLGPRDDAWLARATRDARLAADIRPWWADVTDARYLLQRALVILWTEIRWRPPADDDERATMDEALGLLRRALPSDASLPYPWREWAELITLRGIPDPIADRVLRQAERTDAARPPIGYRRRPVTITHEGWVLDVPGAFGERRTPESWAGGERGRQVTLAASVNRTANGMPMSADWYLARVAGDLGAGVLHHHEGELVRPREGDDGRELGARGRRARGLLRRHRPGGRDPRRVRGRRRLALGRRPVEVPPPGLTAGAPGMRRRARDAQADTRRPVRWAGMQLIDGRPVYSATDLVGYLACDHRLELERAALAGLVEKPIRNDPSIDLVARRGMEHERRYLAELRERGPSRRGDREGRLGRRAARRTRRDAEARRRRGAARGGDPDDRGDARRARRWSTRRRSSTAPGGGTRTSCCGGTTTRRARQRLRVVALRGRGHEARAPREGLRDPADLLVRGAADGPPGHRQPEYLHVVLGGSARPHDSLRVDDYMAYFRLVKRAFEAAVGLRGDTASVVAYPPAATYPEPVEHCDVCRWNPMCRVRRRTDDDLSLVAGASSRQRRALKERGVATRRGLAALELPMAPALEGVGAGALERVREQARIQVESEDRREVRWELLPLDRDASGDPVPDRGLLVLPAPSEGDLFLDLEGDPFALDDGVDYLFGILEPRLPEEGRWAGPDGAVVPRFHAIWSLDERRKRQLAGGEGGVRAHRRPHHGPLGPGPGDARLPLRRL